jgi:carbonic anhydrase
LNDPKKIMNDLIAGNIRFINGETIQSNDSSLKKLKEFAKKGQSPKAIILCCSDSRAPVELIFDQDIGDLFVIRVAGNIIAPSLIGSIEYAVSTFRTNLVLVMGHTECGAVNATINHICDSQSINSENIHDIVSRIKPHIFSIIQNKSINEELKLNLSVEANVIASIDQLTHSSRIIENLVLNKKLMIKGSVLDLSTGLLKLLEI